jgi:hypothetical protein
MEVDEVDYPNVPSNYELFLQVRGQAARQKQKDNNQQTEQTTANDNDKNRMPYSEAAQKGSQRK